jgi:hypothetical protein
MFCQKIEIEGPLHFVRDFTVRLRSIQKMEETMLVE